VREVAVYECIGHHPIYMGQFAFAEYEFTGARWEFKTEQEAQAFVDKEA